MKKIAFFIDEFKNNGVSNQIEILSKSLIELYKVDIYCFKSSKKLNDKKIGLNIIDQSSSFIYKLLKSKSKNEIKKYINGIDADTFIVCDEVFLNYIDKKDYKNINLIYWVHNIYEGMIKNIKLYDSVIVPSDNIKNKYFSDINNVYVIPNAINIVDNIKKYDSNNRIITVSKLSKDKCITDLIYVMKEVVNKNKNIVLNIIGDGEERVNILRLIKSLNLSNNINMLGFYEHEDLIAELKDSDVFIFASNNETFGISVLEAMSIGLPVVVFEDECINEFINDEIDGFIIENRSYEDMAVKVIQLLDNQKLQKEIGSCAVEKSRNFDVNVIKREWLRIIK